MKAQPEGTQHEIVYKADPFALIFRELDLIHSDIREIKSEITFLHKRIDETNKRIDETNRRIDELSTEINRRLDRLFIIVIINLLGILGFLLKFIFMAS